MVYQAVRNFTITNVDITGTEIKYYGQESTSMGDTTGVYFSGTASPQQYYGGGGGTLPGDAELLNQAGDPNSMYSQLNVLSSNIGNQYTTKQCSIKRQVSLTPHMEMVGYDVSFYVGYDADGSSKECFWATNTGNCRDVWAYGNGWGACENLNLVHLGKIIHSIVATGSCIPYTDPVSGGSGCYSPPGTIDVHSYEFVQRTNSGTSPGCYGSNNDSSHQFWHIRAFTVDNIDQYTLTTQGNLIIGVKDNPGASTTGSCAALDLTDCTMLEETVCDHNDAACVHTYRNYNPTGLAPLGSCQQVPSPNTGLTWTFCADGSNLTYQQGSQSGVLESGTDVWWNIHRTYSCETNNVYDFTNAQQRSGHIQDSLSDNGATLTFQDFNPDTGATTNNSISLPPREDVERCEKSCIVKIPVQDTQASLTRTTADYRASVNTHKEILRACENGVCPVNAGEVLVKDCKCTNYFNQAATTLQLVHDAGRDMICSGSPP
ncbi:MAG: hypothetical protein DRO93_10875 [Candidatus Thorarchaeota archaeon]|nr:MAG: hypothetical protein DRO93_10875 [Candidatus Thorarchaeota archaeon]